MMLGSTGPKVVLSERIALTQDQVLCLTIWGEARDQTLEGKVAVGGVIRNRLELGKWGDTYAGVCWYPWQFSCWRKEGGAANYERVMAAADQLSAGVDTENQILRECGWIAAGISGRWLRDVTDDATHYLTNALYESPKAPAWARSMHVTKVIGAHTFLRDAPKKK